MDFLSFTQGQKYIYRLKYPHTPVTTPKLRYDVRQKMKNTGRVNKICIIANIALFKNI